LRPSKTARLNLPYRAMKFSRLGAAQNALNLNGAAYARIKRREQSLNLGRGSDI